MKLCFIDTETTGTNPEKHSVVQIAGAIGTLNEDNSVTIHERFNLLARPLSVGVIEDEALKVIGKTREELMTYPQASTTYSQLTSILGRYCDKYNRKDKMYLIGYNARFDYDMLREWFAKLGDKYFGSWFFFPPIDVMNMAVVELMATRHALPNFKLATVAEALEIKVEGQYHDAQMDIEVTRLIFERCCRMFSKTSLPKASENQLLLVD